MTNIDKMIEVMQAYKDGAEIEYSLRPYTGYWNDAATPTWSWDSIDYRIKEPEPTKGKVWIVIVDGRSPSDGVPYKKALVYRGDINGTPAVYGTKAAAEALAQAMRERSPGLTYTVKEMEL